VALIRHTRESVLRMANTALIDLERGFSDKNLWMMKQFYETYKDSEEKLSPVVRQISWTNNLIIFTRARQSKKVKF